MKIFKSILVASIISFGFVSCEDNSDDIKENEPITEDSKPVVDDSKSPLSKETKNVTNLNRDKVYGMFDLDNDKTIENGDDWDIAFYSTTLVVNGGEVVVAEPGNDREGNPIPKEPIRTADGGAYLLADTTFDKVTKADISLFQQDSSAGLAIPKGSGNGWYTYTGNPLHQILATPGRIIIVKTSEGNYVKVEMLSYYKDGDTAKDSRYFSFRHAFID